MQEEGPAPTMPPDTPAQLSQLGLTVEQVQAAKASGAPVEVLLVRILSMPAGPERAALLDAVRQKPDGLHGEEARLFNPAEQLDAAALRLAERREQSRACAPRKAACVRSSWERDSPLMWRNDIRPCNGPMPRRSAPRYGADPVETLRSRSFAQGEQAPGGRRAGSSHVPKQRGHAPRLCGRSAGRNAAGQKIILWAGHGWQDGSEHSRQRDNPCIGSGTAYQIGTS